MTDYFPLLAAFLTLSVCGACYFRNRLLRRRNTSEPSYEILPAAQMPKPSAPPMPTMYEEDPRV